MIPEVARFREAFQQKTKEDKSVLLASLSDDELIWIYENPDIFMFDKQIIPEGLWRYCLLMCGRRFGKSEGGSAWIAKKVIGGSKSLGLCGEDYSTTENIMVKNVLSKFPRGIATYHSQKHKISFSGKYKGAEIYCYTSDKEVKGPSLEYLWADEVGNWCDRNPEKTQIRFDSLDTAVSVGPHPQTIITTTPRAFPFFFDYQKKIDEGSRNHILMTGTMFDNPFLSEGYRQKELDKYKEKPLLLRQEIYGELVFETPGALFQREWIDRNRIVDSTNDKRIHDRDVEYFFGKVGKGEIIIKRCVIAIDPSGSSKKTSDETGIIVLLQAMNGEVYVVYDKSDVYTPDAWARQVRNLFQHFSKKFQTCIVVETNFGGDLVISNILAVDHKLQPFIKEIKASKSKMIRAETSAAKYQRDKIHHVGWLDRLERQMLNYTGTKDATSTGSKSPDRMDALVHGINELVVVPQYAARDLRILQGY